MRKVLSPEANFEIDLELPMECWDLEELEEGSANLFRLCYMAGYIKATKDAKSGRIGSLIKRVSRKQQQSEAVA